MLKFNQIKDFSVANKNVIVRVDINVPINNGIITDDTRIRAILPTLEYLVKENAKVIVISHFGRPEGQFKKEMSISQLVSRIKDLIPEIKVNFIDDCIGEKVKNAIEKTNYGEIIILENLRFYKEETKNDETFSKNLANFADLYINDAFSCSHRSHSSITGITSFLPSCAGLLMEKELNNLNNIFNNSEESMLAIVGGSKVSTKINLLKSLVGKVKCLVVGGGMANSFLYALGYNIGSSLCEKELKEDALEIIQKAKINKCKIILPTDVVVTESLVNNSHCKIKNINNIEENEIVVDIGFSTTIAIDQELQNHQKVLWNGPVGAFEIRPFNIGTENIARIIAGLTYQKKIISIAGGGDVVSALNGSGLINEFSYISTAGGAFLEWLEGKNLPGILALSK
ncbi:MAG: phosphoglycerate kinase [Rickettsiales bacterium]|jgi:phosphoglycerate kinase|nr:phosphoglycerate kinase [Rickettsiales bacterium]